MSLEMDLLVAGTSLTIGIVSILKTVLSLFKKKKGKTIGIVFQGKRIEVPESTAAEEIELLIERLRKFEKVGCSHKKPENKESGYILSEVFLYLVPGVIALLFSGTFIYLIVNHEDVPGYATPEELSSVLKIIVGYFFGVGAATASHRGKTLTAEDLQKIIA